MALSNSGEFLALALENFEVWILKLGWKSLEDQTSDRKSIKDVNHHATLEGHRSLVTGLHYFGNLNKLSHSLSICESIQFEPFLKSSRIKLQKFQ